MPIVLDANIALEWFTGTASQISTVALNAVVLEGAIVPALWRWEMQDVLRRLELAGRLTQPAGRVRNELRELPIVVDEGLTALFGTESLLAARYSLTVYDAAYLELAQRLHLPLATNDRPLASAAKSAKLPPMRGR